MKQHKGLDAQIDRLRTKWPQAHYVEPCGGGMWGYFTIFIPSLVLPRGYNKTICTAIFQARISDDGELQHSPLQEFWIDQADLQLVPPYEETAEDSDGPFTRQHVWPKYSHDCTGKFGGILPCNGHRAGIWDGVPGLPQWRDVRLFLWHQQHFNPNHMSLFTSAMLIKQRLELVM